ncbi:hypothetical protein HN51_068968 [Arachis hypogaea]|uniref:Uncharacterized protein n=1 Tax=Arachis hypogaea TaxID=3818 RepID=A0A444Z843_ARAHY|nr:uncharacterized protein LOC107643142 [Arachis ipaensis]XP_025653895.1 uncharacterized protein LOC112749749 [Arachis hypogaea]QHO11136.1 uncharacterized protein DS421_15g495540 [Arachis hypogaea]RYR10362.1 hypothetical protein Ahy_B05g078828 [Arachis hypogaea]
MGMATTMLWNLQKLWPFSLFRNDDVSDSKRIVSKLPIPQHTKQFVYAFHDPQTQSSIYVLSALSLSERSASDARSLIAAIKPDAVLVHADPSFLDEEEAVSVNTPLPTSSFGVIKRCFVDRIDQESYENLAGSFVLREIFGTGFHGHVLAAKLAAEEVGSSFFVISSPFVNYCLINNSSNGSNNSDRVRVGGGSILQVQGLVNGATTGFSLSPTRSYRRLCLNNDVHSQLVKALSLCLEPFSTSSGSSSMENEIKPMSSYEIPAFARSTYPLLEDLHDIFSDVPSIGKALAHVQKMLVDVSRGEVLDRRTVSEVYAFRIAVEVLRIGLSKNGLRPIKRKGAPKKGEEVKFSELPLEDKSHALLAQVIRWQSDKYKTIVAVVDAGALEGLRKHWDTPVPPQVKDIVGQITHCGREGDFLIHDDRKWLLADRPMVAVSAGASAILGASLLSKAVPASSVLKAVTYKVPASLKLILNQTQRALAFAFGSSKAAAGVKASSTIRAAASATKIRAVTHSIIEYAERTSISAMRTAFYEIMRKRKMQRVGFLPLATFACSMGTCTGLIMYGDGIECAVESVPAAPSIASLGRGIQHLREASQAVMQAEGTRIQKSIESLINRITRSKDG